MITIDSQQIENLFILLLVDWVTQSFRMKKDSQLPAKFPCTLQEMIFTTMPCLLPSDKSGSVLK